MYSVNYPIRRPLWPAAKSNLRKNQPRFNAVPLDEVKHADGKSFYLILPSKETPNNTVKLHCIIGGSKKSQKLKTNLYEKDDVKYVVTNSTYIHPLMEPKDINTVELCMVDLSYKSESGEWVPNSSMTLFVQKDNKHKKAMVLNLDPYPSSDARSQA